MPGRPACGQLTNQMMTPEQINMTGANNIGVMFAPGDTTVVQTKLKDGGRPMAGPGDGLGAAGTSLHWSSGAHWVCLAAVALVLVW